MVQPLNDPVKLAGHTVERSTLTGLKAASAKSGVSIQYLVAKAAQESLALTLAEEYRGSGLPANVIHVRSIDARGQGQGTSPDEIVAAMLYLFSEQADRLSGARIPLY
jgi:NAD(P)-dependent dehydrogenase (short-subunit alcohol dehydrogenase family)